MSVYDHRCGDCQVCPSCGGNAWCENDRVLVVPCEHHGYCGDCNLDNCQDCRVAALLEDNGETFVDPWRGPIADPDPLGPLAAEARADNDRFWGTVGDRPRRKDDTA